MLTEHIDIMRRRSSSRSLAGKKEDDMFKYRQLYQRDIDGLHDIDRSDFSPTTYRVKRGELILEDREFRYTGFTRSEWDNYIRKFSAELQNSATILFGAFNGPTLVGISDIVLSNIFLKHN